MKILLSGANGQVGWEIARRATTLGYDLLALNHAGLDITDAGAVESIVTDKRPEMVINAAAYTAVDRAEQEPDRALAVNRDGPAHLAAACARLGLPLLHISTDYVFDGRKPPLAAYSEDDPVSPLGVYGRSKWEGEEAVRRILPAHIILRVSWVFGVHGHNFVKTMLRLARERDELRVVADQYGCPTYAGDIADTLLILAEHINKGASGRSKGASGRSPLLWGTYHYGGAPPTTWYDFAKVILQTASRFTTRVSPRITPITTADYPTLSARPANSILECIRIRERFGIEPRPWLRGLEAMLTNYLAAENAGARRERS